MANGYVDHWPIERVPFSNLARFIRPRNVVIKSYPSCMHVKDLRLELPTQGKKEDQEEYTYKVKYEKKM